MATLEKIQELKKQGIPENEIITKLKNEGISPMEITDALDQSKIKEAVSAGNPTEGMQPSIMGSGGEKTYSAQSQQQPPAPQTPTQTPTQTPIPAPSQNYGIQTGPGQEDYSAYTAQEENYVAPEPITEEYAQPEEEAYYEGGYQEETYAQDQGYAINSDTMIEVAEQVFSEKIKDIENNLKELNEFKTIFSSKSEEMNQRLKRIEKQFDKMQIAILDRIGSYGKNIDNLKKEVKMVEETIEKINKH